MTIAVLIVRVAMAVVFAVAGYTKLADRRGSVAAMRGFGVSAGVAAPLAVALPVAEIVIAALLLPARTAWIGAVCALVLTLIFTVAIVRMLARGQTPDCHCFGRLHSAPIGPGTLARGLVLMAAAAFVVAAGRVPGQTSAVRWIAGLDAPRAAMVLEGVVIIVLLALGTRLALSALRAHGRLMIRVDRLERMLAEAGFDPLDDPEGEALLGTRATPFSLPGTDGGSRSLHELVTAGRPVLLVFADPECEPCRDLLPAVAEWARTDDAYLTVAVLSGGAADDVRREAARVDLPTPVLLDGDRAVAEAFQAAQTPAGVLIASDGQVIGGPLFGAEGVERLYTRAMGRQEADDAPAGPGVGEPAPPVVLTSLDGDRVDLSVPRGVPTLVLFWNPHCGYCNAMRDDVRAWEGTRPPDAPDLIVVTSGSVDAARAEDFSSTVLLDATFAAATAFGAGGTPTAVLIDADGRLASPVVGGREAVLELARHPDLERV